MFLFKYVYEEYPLSHIYVVGKQSFQIIVAILLWYYTDTRNVVVFWRLAATWNLSSYLCAFCVLLHENPRIYLALWKDLLFTCDFVNHVLVFPNIFVHWVDLATVDTSYYTMWKKKYNIHEYCNSLAILGSCKAKGGRYNLQNCTFCQKP